MRPGHKDENGIATSHARASITGLFILFLCFGVFGMWSITAPLTGAALAPGQVVVRGHRKSIEHLEGGIVVQMAATDGDLVSAGDLLIRLDNTGAREQLETAMGQHYALSAQIARLRAERDNLDEVYFPEELTDSKDPRAYDALRSQRQLFVAGRSARLGEVALLEQTIAQLQQQIVGLDVLQSGKRRLAESYASDISDFSSLFNEGFVDKQRLRELERDLTRTETELAEAVTRSAQHHIELGEARLQILQIDKNFQAAVMDKLSQIEPQLYSLSERIRAAADRSRRTQILAPVDGVVVGMTITTLGEVVRPGEPLLYLVPQTEELIVHARVNPIDIDRVRNGQSANVRFSSFSSATTPVMPGRVLSVSADALTDEQSGLSYFLAQVQFDTSTPQPSQPLTLVPGMPAEVLIITGSRTLFQYLTQPVRNAFARSLIED